MRDFCNLSLLPRESHTIILAGIIQGLVRWEVETKELCFDGIRYSLMKDEWGCPQLPNDLNTKLVGALNALDKP